MISYRDTLTYPSDTTVVTQGQIEEYIVGIGFIHGHKSKLSVEFEFEAEDMWEACERAYELALEVQSRGIDYTPDKGNCSEVENG